MSLPLPRPYLLPPTRRDFFAAAVLLAGAGIVGLADEKKKARLGFSTWSLHNYFPRTRSRPAFKTEDWTLQKAVRAARERFELRHFEVSSAHLASTDSKYIDDIRAFFEDEKCGLIHPSDNFRGVNLCKPGLADRQKDIDLYKKWFEIAARLGSPSLRVNTGGPEQGKDWDFRLTIDTFKELARAAKQHGVQIVVENHFGLSADPKNVIRIIEAVGENISACPDLGLFDPQTRFEGLALMIPHARHICSTKFHDFDAAGQHKDFDYKRCLQTLRDRGFAGWASLEYQGMQEPWRHIELGKKLAAEVLGA